MYGHFKASSGFIKKSDEFPPVAPPGYRKNVGECFSEVGKWKRRGRIRRCNQRRLESKKR